MLSPEQSQKAILDTVLSWETDVQSPPALM
jgi:hypothetical protein